ncbi:hypothetical protein KRM28CT15_03560 [Krasilnikovia sp. M28-CT-15]
MPGFFLTLAGAAAMAAMGVSPHTLEPYGPVVEQRWGSLARLSLAQSQSLRRKTMYSAPARTAVTAVDAMKPDIWPKPG